MCEIDTLGDLANYPDKPVWSYPDLPLLHMWENCPLQFVGKGPIPITNMTNLMTIFSTLGRVENQKIWKITKPQVDPIDAHKNETICMI